MLIMKRRHSWLFWSLVLKLELSRFVAYPFNLDFMRKSGRRFFG